MWIFISIYLILGLISLVAIICRDTYGFLYLLNPIIVVYIVLLYPIAWIFILKEEWEKRRV